QRAVYLLGHGADAVNHKARINPLDAATNTCRRRLRVAHHPHVKHVCRVLAELPERLEDHRAWRDAQAGVPGVLYNPYDLELASRLRSLVAEAVAERILPRKKLASEGLIDDRYQRRADAVAGGEFAPHEQRGAAHSEKVWAYEVGADGTVSLCGVALH